MDTSPPSKKRRVEQDKDDRQGFVPSSAGDHHDAVAGFDKCAFETFVGVAVPERVFSTIRNVCGSDMQRAVNMFLDGTWDRTPEREERTYFSEQPLPSRVPVHDRAGNMPRQRYIGAFGAEGWVTRTGFRLRHGDAVKIDRHKIQGPRHASGKSRPRPGTSAVVQANGISQSRVDVIVRFCTTDGTEIGRLSKQTANWVSTLMDQKICNFTGVCVYAPDNLRTNDTVYLQVRCFLLRTAFSNDITDFFDETSSPKHPFESEESGYERMLRFRQVALAQLVQEINLSPNRANSAAARGKWRDLLGATELPGQRQNGHEQQTNGDHTDSPEEGKELDQNQLDEFYKAQYLDFNAPQADPVESFAMSLRPYQKQALHWMLAREYGDKREQAEISMHPLWEEYTWPIKDADDEDILPVAGHTKFYVNPYSGDLSLDLPVQDQQCRGGILADEMGLGKTIQMLALIHSHKPSTPREACGASQPTTLPSDSSGMRTASCTTLVVAPMSLLAQWQSETENASKEGTIRTTLYYGPDKNMNLRARCCGATATSVPHVVITSYGVVLSEFTQMTSTARKSRQQEDQTGLFSLKFWRVILDEAHMIKNRNAKISRACCELAADNRWVVTGTPIVNRLEDLFSLVKFLKVEPWNNFSFWRTFISAPFESGDVTRALDIVQTVLEPLVLRRTKDMKTPEGNSLVGLPLKHTEVVLIELSKPERDVYDYIYLRAQQSFKSNVEAGTVLKSYTSIFAHILRLRQSCDHPSLVRNRDILADEEEEAASASVSVDDMELESLVDRFTAHPSKERNNFGAHVLKQIRDEMQTECPVCAEEPMRDHTVTGCWHSACRECLTTYITRQTDKGDTARCFTCREPISMRDLFEVVRHNDFQTSEYGVANRRISKMSLQRLGSDKTSAKTSYLLRNLRQMREESPRVKSVVFSQFTSFLTLLEPALARAGFDYVRLDGSMAQKARAETLDIFKSSPRFMVLLISLRAGGVGLNLTCAQNVFMMDPWWSPAVEAQAIDRVHRMGQEKEVHVHRLIVKNSVEERMLKVQERKHYIASSLGMESQEERKLQTLEDIRELLS